MNGGSQCIRMDKHHLRPARPAHTKGPNSMNEFLRSARGFTYAVAGVDSSSPSSTVNSADDSDGMSSMFSSNMAQEAQDYQQMNAVQQAEHHEQSWGDAALKAGTKISVS